MARTYRRYQEKIKKNPEKWSCHAGKTFNIAHPIKHPEKYTGWLFEDNSGPIAHRRFKKWLKKAARNLAKRFIRQEVEDVQI